MRSIWKRTVLLLVLCSCDRVAIGSETTIAVMTHAAPGVQRLGDPYLLEQSMPASIAQMEGLLVVQPGSAPLRQMLLRAYCTYGSALLEERLEAAETAGDERQVDEFRARASLAYERAKELALGSLVGQADFPGGVERLVLAAPQPFEAWLARFGDSTQGATLFWGAFAWARWIGLHRSDPAALAELPLAIAMARRARDLAPSYQDFAPRMLVAGLDAARPEALGGHPREAGEEMERVLALTGRRNLLYLVTHARTVAMTLGDREQYVRDLREVICANPRQDPDLRMSNAIAQRRARRYWTELDRVFEPSSEPLPELDAEGFCEAGEPGRPSEP